MKADQRENLRYESGIRCEINSEEKVMFNFLDKYSQPNSKLLDIGCGTGDISREIEKKGHKVTGVDFSTAAIKIAKVSGLNCDVVDVDEGLPFKKNSFDLVWAGDLIEHVFDPIFVFEEINRVLVPNGHLFITVPNDLHIANRLKILFGKSYQESVLKEYGQYKHHTFFSKGLLNFMLKKNSFKTQEMIYKCRIPYIEKKFIIKNISLPFFVDTFILVANSNY